MITMPTVPKPHKHSPHPIPSSLNTMPLHIPPINHIILFRKQINSRRALRIPKPLILQPPPRLRNNIILKPNQHIIQEPEDGEREHAEEEPETSNDDVLSKGFLEGGCVIEVSWVAGRAVKTERLTGKLVSYTSVVCFGELDGFVGAAVGETVDEDVPV